MNDNNKQILFLQPVFKEMIWGGNRMRSEFSYDIPSEKTGECWAVSAHDNGSCLVRTGEFKGLSLAQLWKEQPKLFGNTGTDRFPLLTKIIDAKEDLSIQVHPDDNYAMQNENGSLGKTECWYILDCEDNASIVMGHNAADREELKRMIEDGKWDTLLREVPVKKGEFIQINPGTVHAIKGGTMILETQQNSDITYRVYDYGRLTDKKPRELHIKQSLEVINVPGRENLTVASASDLPGDCMNELISCPYYKVWKLSTTKPFSLEQTYPFLIFSVIEGKGEIDHHSLVKGDHFILPSDYGTVKIQGEMEFIISTVNQ